MRNCQICGESARREVFRHYNHPEMDLFACASCGFRYVDGDSLSQDWFDHYYLTEYTTSDTPYSFERYQSLAQYVAERATDVLDIGGKDGELHEHFAKIQGLNYDAMGVGENPERKYGCVVLSHTLEHIYEIAPSFALIAAALDGPADRGGWLVIEVPIHLEYVDPGDYDNHWQHINKFRPQDLTRLLVGRGYVIVESVQIDDYREYKCWRIAGRKAG